MATAKAPKFKRFCQQGKTYRDGFEFNDKYENPIDYSEYSARIEIRTAIPTETSTPGDSDVLVTLSTETGEIVINNNRVSITIDSEVTATFPVNTYFWELELFSADDPPYIPTIMQPSSFVVTPEVTLND
jgi:hypothetical protein